MSAPSEKFDYITVIVPAVDRATMRRIKSWALRHRATATLGRSRRGVWVGYVRIHTTYFTQTGNEEVQLRSIIEGTDNRR